MIFEYLDSVQKLVQLDPDILTVWQFTDRSTGATQWNGEEPGSGGDVSIQGTGSSTGLLQWSLAAMVDKEFVISERTLHHLHKDLVTWAIALQHKTRKRKDLAFEIQACADNLETVLRAAKDKSAKKEKGS